jgi:hypothetical protein
MCYLSNAWVSFTGLLQAGGGTMLPPCRAQAELRHAVHHAVLCHAVPTP